jgi:competence protein ComGF
MLGKDLLIELFQAAEMRRWNDKLCPVPLTELDKQGHKMAIAYVLGKFAEHSSNFSWIEVIEGGLFEYFERLTLTDLKPQIFERIKENDETFTELKTEVYTRFAPLISDLNGLDKRFEAYLFRPPDTISHKVLDAAHFYATKWEFDIIERENTSDYEIHEIRRGLQRRQEALADVEGLRTSPFSRPIGALSICAGACDFKCDGGSSTESRGPRCSATCSSSRSSRTCSHSRLTRVPSAVRTTTSPGCFTTCPKSSPRISLVPSKGRPRAWTAS